MPKLPKVPRLFLGKMFPRYFGPEDEEEWEIDVYRKCCTLRVDDTWNYIDVLDKLPPIPVDDITEVKFEQKPRTPPSDDEG